MRATGAILVRRAWSCSAAFILVIAMTMFAAGCGGGAASTTNNGGNTGAASNPVPAITSLSPSSAVVGTSPATVTLTGTGFVQGSTVQWNSSNRIVTYVSSTELQITPTAADMSAAGSAQIVVSNPAPGGGASSAATFTVNNPVPVVSSVTPASITIGTTPPLVSVAGSGFTPSSVIQVNGSSRTTNFVNSGTLTTQLTTADVAATATLTIVVITVGPGGGSSASLACSVGNPAPILQSISPSTIVAGAPNTLMTLRGLQMSLTGTTIQVNGNNVNVSGGISGGGIIPGGSISGVFFFLPASVLTTPSTLSITATNPGSGPSNALSVNVIVAPVPTLTGILPTAAAVGGPSFTLQAVGSGFAFNSVVQWNGTALQTSYVSPTNLSATVPSSEIQLLGNSTVTVSTPSPGGGVSSALPFSTYIGLSANRLIYDATTQLLYASVPSVAGPPYGNSVVPIDPNTGTLGTPIFVGSEPSVMALSSDGNTMWVGLNGAGAVREVNLGTQTAGLQFSLGGGVGYYNNPSTATALAVMPGSPNTVAVASNNTLNSGNTVAVYDSGVMRPNAGGTFINCCGSVTGLAFNPAGTVLYEGGGGYGTATVDSTGITSTTLLNGVYNVASMTVENGLAYLGNGVVLNANTGAQSGVFSVSSTENASGPVAPDSGVGSAYVFLDSSVEGSPAINAYNIATYVLEGTIPLVGASSQNLPAYGSIARWGQDGLAVSTGTQIYILRSTLVRDLSTSLADMSVSASFPATGATGSNLTYNLTVSNAGPLAATPAILTDIIPNGSALQSVTASQGTCSGGAVVSCDLGNLNSGSSVTVQIAVTALSSGTLSNTAMVSAPQGDPNTANNTAVSSTAVTGATYSVSPAVASISPALIQAGSGAFTLTVNGSGFVSNSTVQLNGTPLSTAFVNSTQLTASVPASDVAALGWAWINVTTPGPGGGASTAQVLTVYKSISLDVQKMIFDPYTQKLYATVPSTATQVMGNSLVAIDPNTGALGAPLSVGSGPDPMAESSDGKDLYIGLDGSESLTFVDLTSMTQGPVFPITYHGILGTSSAARDLSVAPGNDNLLAVDTGSENGIGLFDISGSTGTMRPQLTGVYTGSNIRFANSSLLYSLDTDESAGLFKRWDVTSNGLTLDNNTNTGYTINEIGEGYQLLNGLVYGFNGGVADPTTTPPTQIGVFSPSSLYGTPQGFYEGGGVAADPNTGRVFFLGTILGSTANDTVFAFDSQKFVLLGTGQISGQEYGSGLIRWGRDGLAWHSASPGALGSSPGSGQVFMMRGPFVLPEWSTVNPTPTATSVSPASTTHGSGNMLLTVTGANFVPGAVVKWNGAERSTTFADSAHLTVAIPASDVAAAGTANLTVNNPNATDSGTVAFTIN